MNRLGGQQVHLWGIYLLGVKSVSRVEFGALGGSDGSERGELFRRDTRLAQLAGSTYLHGEHGNRTAVYTFDREADEFAGLPRGKNVEQRQVVIGRGD